MERFILIVMAVAIVLLNILDVVTTKQALALGAREANPIVRLLMRWRLFIPVKVAVLIFFIWVILNAEAAAALTAGSFLCLFYGLLVASNVKTIKKIRS